METFSRITSQTGFSHLTDLPCWTLQYNQATAVVSAYGAQVLSYRPAENQELLWLSPKAQWHNNTPIRGGIPLCWPWFGPANPLFNPEQQTLPNHGLVRNRIWQLKLQQETNSCVILVLTTTLDSLPYLPDSVSVDVIISLSDTLLVQLHCSHPLLQQAALHSYFNTGDIHHTQVQPLPLRYHDNLSKEYINDTGTSLSVTSEVDRIYFQTSENLSIQTPAQHIAITQQGHDSTVLWNPWRDRSKQLADINDDDYLKFICVETAHLSVTQAKSLYISQKISITPDDFTAGI